MLKSSSEMLPGSVAPSCPSGSTQAHLHLQGVIRRTVAGGAVNTKDLKFALFAPLDASKATYKCPRENIVTSTQLTGQKLHTWQAYHAMPCM